MRFESYYAERKKRDQWSDLHLNRQGRDHPETGRLRSRSASIERTKASFSSSDPRSFHTPTKENPSHDPPSSTDRFKFDERQPNHSDDELYSKDSRVQFSKKLEVTKTSCTNAEKPSLRTKKRQDPTPRNSKEFEEYNQLREPDGATTHLASSGPPIEGEEQFLSTQRTGAPPTPSSRERSPAATSWRSPLVKAHSDSRSRARIFFSNSSYRDRDSREELPPTPASGSPNPKLHSSTPCRDIDSREELPPTPASRSPYRNNLSRELPPTPSPYRDNLSVEQQREPRAAVPRSLPDPRNRSWSPNRNVKGELPPTPASHSPYRNPSSQELLPTPSPYRNKSRIEPSKKLELGMASLSLEPTRPSEVSSPFQRTSSRDSRLRHIEGKDWHDVSTSRLAMQPIKNQPSTYYGSPRRNTRFKQSSSRDNSPYRRERSTRRESSPYRKSARVHSSVNRFNGSRPSTSIQSRRMQSSSSHISPYRSPGNGGEYRTPLQSQPRSPFLSQIQNSPYRNPRLGLIKEKSEAIRPRTPVQSIVRSIRRTSTPNRSSPYRNSREKIKKFRLHSSTTRTPSEQKESQHPSVLLSEDHMEQQTTPRRSNRKQDANFLSQNNSVEDSAEPSPWHRNTQEILRDLWRNESTFLEKKSSKKSRSKYLIDKYAIVGMEGRVRGIPSLSSSMSSQEVDYRRSKAYRLESRKERNYQNTQGTTSSIPIQVDLENEDTPSFFTTDDSPIESPERKGFLSRLFKRKKRTSLFEVESASSIDESFDIMKKSTSETDDSETEWKFDRKAAQWNDFEHKSMSSEESDDNYLISSNNVEKKKKGCHSAIIFAFILIVCFIGATPPIILLYFSGEEMNPIDLAANSICAGFMQEEEGNFTFSDRYISIRELMTDSSGNISMIESPDSPQRKAICWLADFDEMQLEAEQSNKAALVQRYTMGVVFFSLANNDSEDLRSLRNSDFLSPTHECDWEVTMCKGPGQEGESMTLRYNIPQRLPVVTALLLSDKFLTGQIPEEIANLKNLTYLELNMNEINGSIPTALGELAMLEYLSLDFNSLVNTIPSELGSATRLEFLNLRSSKVNGTIPNELGDLTNLEVLLLDGNRLTGSIPSSLGRLCNAEQFSFRKNDLSGSIPQELCDLREESLEEIKVDSWMDCNCCT